MVAVAVGRSCGSGDSLVHGCAKLEANNDGRQSFRQRAYARLGGGNACTVKGQHDAARFDADDSSPLIRQLQHTPMHTTGAN